MALKRDRRKDERAGENGKKMLTETKTAAMCFITPGPKYQLKALVGYRDHCISRYRNPAYTFGGRRPILEMTESPGPKYMIEKRKFKGFTFGHAAKRRGKNVFLFKSDTHYNSLYYPNSLHLVDIIFGPGPKYKLPDVSRGPFFSIKWRTKLRKIDETPGPYYIKPIAKMPAFSMGLRTVATKPVTSAGPYSSYNLEVIKSRAPMYTIVGARRILRMVSEGPDAIYAIRSPKPTPAFSFGVKHSECAPPYIIECDKQC
ncbi:outer dense fiber protein 3-b-like protein [Lasius niger]|uniref:Outer dense fiber protein 3-b-like protein n=1 Tax=Lasius niger TaxID=67767 RepID=A0A0J7MTX9_LASNI|nr:outer dense fiber protein 3-b-like protein [Lasius niger]